MPWRTVLVMDRERAFTAAGVAAVVMGVCVVGAMAYAEYRSNRVDIVGEADAPASWPTAALVFGAGLGAVVFVALVVVLFVLRDEG